ncbi:hypothetical protein [Sporomusa ovata]|uniref:hypothetical protein n=1 Tax=Sporomusa ovata TaxID=2378 RepID=UPI0030CE2BB1
MLLAADNVKVLALVQSSSAATVIFPSWLPPLPVETVTLVVSNAFCRVAKLTTLSSPDAVNPDVLSTFLFAV